MPSFKFLQQALLLSFAGIALSFPHEGNGEPAAPMPTSPPSERELFWALVKRQGGAQTCGWISHNPTAPVTCGANEFCARDDTDEIFGCCSNPSGCQFPTACVDSASIGRKTDTDTTLYWYGAKTLHGNGSLLTARHSDQSTNTVCNYFYDGDFYTSFFCGTTEDSFYMGDSATNQNGIGISTATQYTDFTVASSATGSLHLPPGGQASVGVSSPSQTGSAGSGGGKGSGGSTGNSTSSGSNSGGSLPTGAVAGIAVGAAIGGAAIIAVGAFFCWRRKKNSSSSSSSNNNNKTTQPLIGQPQMQAGGSYGGGPGAYQSSQAGFVSSAPQSQYPTSQHPGSQHSASQHPSVQQQQQQQQQQHYPGVTTVHDGPSPLSNQNLNSHLAGGSWAGVRPNVPQKQTANMYEEEYDGLGHLPELRPQDAAGEPYHDGRASYMPSEAGHTAAYPASQTVWHQPV